MAKTDDQSPLVKFLLIIATALAICVSGTVLIDNYFDRMDIIHGVYPNRNSKR